MLTMNRRSKLLLACIAMGVVLVLGLGIGPARAYFTDWTEANGGLPISVTPTTDLKETYGARVKHVVVTNDGTAPVFVRARAYASLPLEIAGEGWTQDGEWWVYDRAVPGKKDGAAGETSELTVTLQFPEGATENDGYNVVVVYESTPVQYHADGTPNPDWGFVLDAGTAGATEGGQS